MVYYICVTCRRYLPNENARDYHIAWSDHPNYNILTCALCFETNKKLVKHHIEYYPEYICYLCKSCHSLIHLNKEYFNEYHNYSNDEKNHFSAIRSGYYIKKHIDKENTRLRTYQRLALKRMNN